MSTSPSNPVLFFDGVCDLCNISVQFVIKHDKKKQFRFAPLQSAAGAEALKNTNGVSGSPDSVILYAGGKYYQRSTAVLRTLKMLGMPWSLLYPFSLVPRFIRDAAYKIFAKNRYRWFGRQEQCIVPTPELKARFIS